MRKNKILIIIAGSLIMLSSNMFILKHAEAKNISSTCNSNVENTKDIEDKTGIAKDLFEKYINQNKTDWKYVESRQLDREPVVSLTDYKINDIKIVEEDKDKFTANISYDIQYTDKSDMWIAGNGKVAEKNWIKNKNNFVEFSVDSDVYKIQKIYT